MNDDGQKVEEWAEGENLSLIHDPKLPASFNSGRWKRGYNPDLIFVSDTISHLCTKEIGQPIPNTQHRPIICKIMAAIHPKKVPFKRRFNFQKANWKDFAKTLDENMISIDPKPENYEFLIKHVKTSARKHIPRGCKEYHIPGLTRELEKQLRTYEKLYESNPFDSATIREGEMLSRAISDVKRNKWRDMIKGADMKHSSRKAWSMIIRLNNDPIQTKTSSKITADQIASQLIENGKTGKTGVKRDEYKIQRDRDNETEDLSTSITSEELESAIRNMKDHKAVGLDDIFTEEIRHFGPTTKTWILNLLNNILITQKIPKIWRKTKIITLPKPKKNLTNPKHFRPISLLCHMYKIFERVLLNRLIPFIDGKLIPQQAGFRPGKSCTEQILNLTQTIENGYEAKKITGVVFIDLTAAYDTVNHRIMTHKLYKITHDFRFVKIVEALLSNRRFFVNHNEKNSRRRKSKNGLPQGSVIAPTMFNIYTNDQPISKDQSVNHYIYADDTAVAAQDTSFEIVEKKLTTILKEVGTYYHRNHLRPNPAKTQICSFHLKNREANRKLNVIWDGIELNNAQYAKYLGVTLDRSLTYRAHCEKLKKK